jgi:hypothetical protein
MSQRITIWFAISIRYPESFTPTSFWREVATPPRQHQEGDTDMVLGGELKLKKKEPLTLIVYGPTTLAREEFFQELRKLLRKHGYGGRLVGAVTKTRAGKRKRKS